MTNGDRIRQMSDEELAEIIACSAILPRCEANCWNPKASDCHKRKLTWLQEEVQDDG